jgi:hypothetical protein
MNDEALYRVKGKKLDAKSGQWTDCTVEISVVNGDIDIYEVD